MKIVVVGDSTYRENITKRIALHNLTPENNIIHCDSISSAETFLHTQVANQSQKRHIDLIIVDDIISGSIYQKNLCDWLRCSGEHFSNSNFRLSSIPMILHKKDVNRNLINSQLYNEVIPVSENYMDSRLIDASKRVVRNWRESIVSDLAILKIDKNYFKLGSNTDIFPVNEEYRHVSNNCKYYFKKTTIVSESFIKNPKLLRYDWLSSNKLTKIETSLDRYYKIIRNLHKYNRRAFEREVLHDFYLDNPFFLQRDIYKSQSYEKRYHVSTTSKYHIPDFILESSFPGYTPTSISEIKRHNVDFEYIPKKHENFTRYTNNALHQASNYEDDFLSANMFNRNFQVDLIIGLDDKLTDFIGKKIKKHFSTINIVTHDNLMKYVEDYYIRLKSLSVRPYFKIF